ncbi:MAG: long-chain-fatty-acid--CoA ligase [Actinomycetota bacterium]
MTEHRPWFASYPKGIPHSLEPYPEISVFSMLEAAVRRFPDNVATAWFGAHMTYRTLLDHAERFSAALTGLGVTKGDRVAFILPNCPQYVVAFYGTVRIGAIAVGNNPLYTQREMEHQLRDSGAKVVICLDQLYANYAPVFERLGITDVIVTSVTDYMKFPLKQLAPLKFKREAKHEGKPWPPVAADAPVRRWTSWLAEAGVAPVAATIDPRKDPAAFVYTGGTTGVSKGAMLSHFNVTTNSRQAGVWFGDQIEDGKDALMSILPFFHSYGVTGSLGLAIMYAMKLVIQPRFDLDRTLHDIAKEKPTLFPGVPRIYQALNESPKTAKHDLRSIKVCVSGAAALPPVVAERFHEITGGANIAEGYGLTECSPATHVNPTDGTGRIGTVGVPLPDTDCKIVDLEEPDREVGIGEPGELCIRGPQVMLGYWQRPDETALMIRDGWLHTGDVATMDADGFFRLVDRVKEMVIVSGFNVYPTEVEQVLLRHPAVLKCAVIGVPDERTGEAVKAFVVRREGMAVTEAELLEWARDPERGLTGYRAPKAVEFRDDLPVSVIGKTLRRVLVEEERAKAAAAAPTS